MDTYTDTMSIKKFISSVSNILPLFTAGYVSLTDLPTASLSTVPAFANIFKATTLPEMFNALFTMSISAGGILAVIMIAYAGFKYVVAGADNPGELSKARTRITNAVIGLVLLLSIYVVLWQINPEILKLDALRDVNTLVTTQTQTPSGWCYYDTMGSGNAICSSTQDACVSSCTSKNYSQCGGTNGACLDY